MPSGHELASSLGVLGIGRLDPPSNSLPRREGGLVGSAPGGVVVAEGYSVFVFFIWRS